MTTRVPLLETGKLQARLQEIRARKGSPPWSEAVVLTDDLQAFVICQPPGHPNDTHYHLHDEWWVVLQGEIDWHIEDEPAPIRARAGDFVFGPKNRWHHLEPVGTEPSIRVAINARGEFHRYDRPGCAPLPPRPRTGAVGCQTRGRLAPPRWMRPRELTLPRPCHLAGSRLRRGHTTSASVAARSTVSWSRACFARCACRAAAGSCWIGAILTPSSTRARTGHDDRSTR